MSGPLLRIAKVSSVLLLACLPVSACAVQDAPAARGRGWVVLDSSTESRVYLDSSFVEAADGKYLVWLRVNFPGPATTPVDTTLFWGVQTRHRLDCAELLVEDLEMNSLLDREGTRLDTIPIADTRQKPFAEHMLGRNVFPLACQWLAIHRPPRG
jgi:hypothetical protein